MIKYLFLEATRYFNNKNFVDLRSHNAIPDETYCVQYFAKLDAAKLNSDETNCGDGSDNGK